MTGPAASLTRLDAPQRPRALALVLHGGTQQSQAPVDGRSASWRRMHAMQQRITPALHEAGISTWLLRYRHRGWNTSGTGPQADARWALEEARRELGELPVVLLGHSMGARTAAYVADDASVIGVVGLAPWWQPDDPVRALTGRHLRAAHGRTDKITSARMTQDFVRRATPAAASAEFTDMGRVGHYMLRRVAAWNAFAAAAVLEVAERA